MPLVTNLIDDKSPLISFDATWLPGSAWGDNYASLYYLSTFTTNNVTDGIATFNFNGTAIWIYGATRPNHGSYSVQVDGATFSNLNGGTNNVFQTSLFNTSALSQRMHNIKLTNTGSNGLYVDIDMIVWQSQVGSTNDHLVSEIIQDTDSRFQYQEPAWGPSSSTSNINFALFKNGTGHMTTIYESTVTLTFSGELFAKGEAISLYGTTGPSNGPYSVQLDGGQAVQYDATNAYPTNYDVMLYHADNLGPGSHQLIFTNVPASSGQALTIDYAQLWTIDNSASASSESPSNLQDKLSPGAIAGIVIVVVAALISAGAALFFYQRWKAAIATQHDLYRAYALQQRLPGSGTAAPTGYSSSLETRGSGILLRNDATVQTFSGRALHLDVTAPIAPGSRESRSVADTMNPPARSGADEGLGQRPLPEAPGGGLSLSDEFPKLAPARRPPSVSTFNHGTVTGREAPPPNYNQATRSGSTV